MSDEYKRIVIDGERHYGQHLMLTATDCNDKLLSISKISYFCEVLVDEIDMVAFGDPLVARFGEGIEEGISAVQLIQTSAISLHTNDQSRDLYLDVFSCKEFKEEDVLKVVNEFFAPETTTPQMVYRK